MFENMAEGKRMPNASDTVRAQPIEAVDFDPEPRRTGKIWHVLIDAIVRVRLMARATVRNTKQFLFFALAYKASAVPVAAGILFPFFGILISPMFGATANRLSPFRW